MSKHTPGPWDAIKSQPVEGYNCWWLMAGSIELGTISGYQGDAEREANARLIAAAPKLLEHITLAADVVEELKNMSPELAEAAINMLVPVLRNTIAKAEGKDDAPR